MTTLKWLVGGGAQLQLVAGARCFRIGVSSGSTLQLERTHISCNTCSMVKEYAHHSHPSIVEPFDTLLKLQKPPSRLFTKQQLEIITTQCHSAQDAAYLCGKLSASDQQRRHPPLYQQEDPQPPQLKTSSPNQPGPSALSSHLNRHNRIQKRQKPSHRLNYITFFASPLCPYPNPQPKSSP